MEPYSDLQNLTLPNEAPVMILPGVPLLPNAPLPLFIFEERYRLMLAHSLERDRMFCVALMKPGVTDAVSADDFFAVAGLGLIRACVGNPDGTSHLILQGLARVEFTSFAQEFPFRIARIRVLQSKDSETVQAVALGAKVLEICRSLKSAGHKTPPALDEYLPHLSNPGILADVVANALIEDPLQRQRVLEELVVSDRLRVMIRYLSEQSA